MLNTEIADSPIAVSDLLSRFGKVRDQTMKLAEPLKIEDHVVQPGTDVSPPKWHMAHTTWFFENFILKEQKKDYKVFHDSYGYLFNSYYVSVGDRWSRAERGFLTRPTVDEIVAYRQYVDQHMKEWLSAQQELSADLLYVFEIGLQHEQQHQELFLYDVKQILGDNPLFPVYKAGGSSEPSQSSKSDWLSIEEGKYEIGHQGKGFFFDNEKGCHPVYLLPFEISSNTVTNGEYLDFVEAGGYSSPGYWMMDGFDWIQQNTVTSPKYWHKIENEWYVYQLTGLEKLDLNAPVSHVSFYEADAYARWKGLRLPTEFEWEIAANKYENQVSSQCNFVERQLLKPVSGGMNFMGNLWEWTGSAYRPYPKYEAPEGALGEYNGKFMINQMVLRGGSYATPIDHIRHTYRNFFHPHLQWLFNGIRLAKHI